MLLNENCQTLEEWKRTVRGEIRSLIAQSDPYEKINHVRRRVMALNPVRIRPGGGVSERRIQQLAWRQIMEEEIETWNRVMTKQKVYADLHDKAFGAEIAGKHKKERLRLVSRRKIR